MIGVISKEMIGNLIILCVIVIERANHYLLTMSGRFAPWKSPHVSTHSLVCTQPSSSSERELQADPNLLAIDGINQTPIQNLLAVSKTTKELVLHWKNESGVDISSEVKMPQYEIFKVIPAKCQETLLGTGE